MFDLLHLRYEHRDELIVCNSSISFNGKTTHEHVYLFRSEGFSQVAQNTTQFSFRDGSLSCGIKNFESFSHFSFLINWFWCWFSVVLLQSSKVEFLSTEFFDPFLYILFRRILTKSTDESSDELRIAGRAVFGKYSEYVSSVWGRHVVYAPHCFPC